MTTHRTITFAILFALAVPEAARTQQTNQGAARPSSLDGCAKAADFKKYLAIAEDKREWFRAQFKDFGFANTMADWLPDQNASVAAAMTLEAAVSLDDLDKLIAQAGRTDAFDEIHALAEQLYDPVQRRWTSEQARALVGASAERRGAWKDGLAALRDMSNMSLEMREQIAQLPEACRGGAAPASPPPPRDPNLAAVVRQIESGDAAGALVALKEVESWFRYDHPTLGHVVVYRIRAHLALKDPERAGYDAGFALLMNPNLSVTTEEFPPDVVALFNEVANGATVSVYFPAARNAKGLKMPVFCDGRHQGDLENGRYMILSVPSGQHTFDFRAQTMTVTIERHVEYYFRAEAIGSGRSAGFTVRVVDRKAGKDEIFDNHIAYTPADDDCYSRTQLP